MKKTLEPSISILSKLGSIAIHAEEMISPNVHEFDLIEMKKLLNDPEIQQWLKEMDEMALIPKKR